MTGYQRLLGYGIMKHAKEKGATAKQAFPFHACFNEQRFLRSRKKSSVRAYLRVCRRPKRKASDTTLDTKEEDVYEKNAV